MGKNFEVRTAILVDGAYYRERAETLAGYKEPKDRADELERYCLDLLHDKYENRFLHRIFYYDCPPSKKNVFHPLLRRTINLGKSDTCKWMETFLDELKSKRKFALRLGRLSDTNLNYNLKPTSTKKLLSGKKKIEDLSKKDFKLNITQKGVDMRIGVDITTLAFTKQVNQIILIAGDSDFVPAAKQARREGIDFILNPMENHIAEDLHEHIDGIRSPKLKP